MLSDAIPRPPIRITQRDIDRFAEMSQMEASLRDDGFHLIAGVDEAGRGPLAGPVVAAACILPEGEAFYGLNDSKKMTEKRREALFHEIRDRARAWSVAMVTNLDIDRFNILEATKEAMRQALRGLREKPDAALIDAVALEGFDYPVIAEIHGDARCNAIAAASVLAKVTRDAMMKSWDTVYPVYGFSSHKGYGTKEHMEALRRYGPCPIHRASFIGSILEDRKEKMTSFDRGKYIECRVAEDLIAKGHTILEHRYAIHRIGEVDFITSHRGVISIVECKGRGPSTSVFGGADGSLRSDQAGRIRRVAEAWLQANSLTETPVEFWFAAVDMDESGRTACIHYTPIE